MPGASTLQVPWSDIDTLLLDMDGTLLDLAFDNHFWLDVVPERYAAMRGMPVARAREDVHGRYAKVIGTLPWYCVDYWTDELGIDIRALKRANSHRISYLPTAMAFLGSARERVARLILVTNAHRATLEIKAAVTGIDRWVDTVVSSHDYRAPKEAAAFWTALVRDHAIDPARCLLLDDSLPVLAAARAFGIAHIVAISRPDSRHGRREVEEFDAVEHVGELI